MKAGAGGELGFRLLGLYPSGVSFPTIPVFHCFKSSRMVALPPLRELSFFHSFVNIREKENDS